MALKDKIIDKAQKYMLKGNLDKALAEYKSALDLDPRDVSIRLRIGDLYVKTNSMDEAIKEYTEVAKANAQRGFYPKAIAVYKKVLKLDDSILDIHYKLAELYTKQRLIADAISSYSYIVSTFEKKGKTSEVMELLKKMLDIDPDNVGIRLKLADLFVKLSFDKDAAAEYAEIFKKLIADGKIERAEKVFLSLYNAKPKEPVILKALAEIYKTKGDEEKYLNYAKPLLKSYTKSEDLENAMALSKAILEVRPDDKDALEIVHGLEPPELIHPEEDERAAGEPSAAVPDVEAAAAEAAAGGETPAEDFSAARSEPVEEAPEEAESEKGDELISWPEEEIEISVEGFDDEQAAPAGADEEAFKDEEEFVVSGGEAAAGEEAGDAAAQEPAPVEENHAEEEVSLETAAEDLSAASSQPVEEPSGEAESEEVSAEEPLQVEETAEHTPEAPAVEKASVEDETEPEIEIDLGDYGVDRSVEMAAEEAVGIEEEAEPVEEPVAEEPIAEEPAPVEEPVVEEEVPVEAAAEEAVGIEEEAEPVAEELTAEEPVIEEPIAEEIVVDEVAGEETPVEEFSAAMSEPTGEAEGELSVEEPVAEEPIAEEPAPVEEPVFEEEVPVETAAEEAVGIEEEAEPVEEPVAEESVAEEPVPVEEPVFEEEVPVEAAAEEAVGIEEEAEPVAEEIAVDEGAEEETPVEEFSAATSEPTGEAEGELSVEEPVAEEPIAEEPAPVEEPVVEEEVPVEAAAEESVEIEEETAPVEELTVEEPVAAVPDVEGDVPVEGAEEETPVEEFSAATSEPTGEAVEELSVEEPSAEEPIAEEPAPVEEPVVEEEVPVEAAAEEAVEIEEEIAPVEEPVAEEPAVEEPAPVGEPVAEEPAPVEEPVVEEEVPVETAAEEAVGIEEEPAPEESPLEAMEEPAAEAPAEDRFDFIEPRSAESLEEAVERVLSDDEPFIVDAPPAPEPEVEAPSFESAPSVGETPQSGGEAELAPEADDAAAESLESFGLDDELSSAIEELQARMDSDEMFVEPEKAKIEESAPESEFIDLSAELGMEEALEGLAGTWTQNEGESTDAFDEYKDGIGHQLSKEDTETHYNLGIAYMEMELFDEAAKEFKIALKEPRLEGDCYARLGLCAMAESKPDEAVMYYLKGLKVEGKSEDERKGMMYELALAYEAAGDMDEAFQLFTSINDLDPGYREVEEHLSGFDRDMPYIPVDDGLIEVELL